MVIERRIRVLIVDDHSIVRRGIAFMLSTQPDMEVVGEAADGREAVQKVLALKPHVVLMDLSMPQGLDGIAAAEEIKDQFPEVKVIVLTMYDEDVYLCRLLRNGVEGFLLKQTAGENLIQAIRQVMNGDYWFESELPKEIVDEMKQRPEPENCDEDAVILTEREREVLVFLARGYQNREVAKELNISVKTVENHKANMMRKLGVSTVRELIEYGRRNRLLDLYR
ncbi:two component transcriptional regulator, LuxR family [Kyrpidia tusciae DSM 2912]|uniref:Two component transcriptional regulator, LuxR family n=1 Tax=Kyrpidia tusciae (strain DSM 2912 / NBRC 15312 / T2) TaxID=562970 RepID=D5WUI4_KYRT2|nr:two component transcriptional regulator, LuxR family [Kyrpidia tusciae DSM 2912]